MTIEELTEYLDKCEASKFGNGRASIVVGHRKDPGLRVRLTPQGGPLGDILCDNAERGIVASFEISAVRKWLKGSSE